MQRLGKNQNGYFGDTVDIEAVLGDCVAAGCAYNWSVEELLAATSANSLDLTNLSSSPNLSNSRNLLAFTRPAAGSRDQKRIYLSTGIHGDEPAGPLAMRQLLQENQWPENVSLWVLPCLNPTGFALNRRENAEGVDLNREYLNPKAAETLAHIAWLKKQPEFDLCLALHEDWEAHGFYVYELNPDNRPSLAEVMVARVAEVCPVDQSEIIEGRPAQNGIIRPNLDPRDRPLWPESIYLLTQKTRLSYTIEAPSDYPLSTRVAALVTAVRAAIETV